MFIIFMLIYFTVVPFILAFIDDTKTRLLMLAGLIALPLIPTAILRGYIYVAVFEGDSVLKAVLFQFAFVGVIYGLGRFCAGIGAMRRRARENARKRTWAEVDAAAKGKVHHEGRVTYELVSRKGTNQMRMA